MIKLLMMMVSTVACERWWWCCWRCLTVTWNTHTHTDDDATGSTWNAMHTVNASTPRQIVLISNWMHSAAHCICAFVRYVIDVLLGYDKLWVCARWTPPDNIQSSGAIKNIRIFELMAQNKHAEPKSLWLLISSIYMKYTITEQ